MSTENEKPPADDPPDEGKWKLPPCTLSEADLALAASIQGKYQGWHSHQYDGVLGTLPEWAPSIALIAFHDAQASLIDEVCGGDTEKARRCFELYIKPVVTGVRFKNAVPVQTPEDRKLAGTALQTLGLIWRALQLGKKEALEMLAGGDPALGMSTAKNLEGGRGKGAKSQKEQAAVRRSLLLKTCIETLRAKPSWSDREVIKHVQDLVPKRSADATLNRPSELYSERIVGDILRKAKKEVRNATLATDVRK